MHFDEVFTIDEDDSICNGGERRILLIDGDVIFYLFYGSDTTY